MEGLYIEIHQRSFEWYHLRPPYDLRSLKNFQGTHIQGATCGHLCDSTVFLLPVGRSKTYHNTFHRGSSSKPLRGRGDAPYFRTFSSYSWESHRSLWLGWGGGSLQWTPPMASYAAGSSLPWLRPLAEHSVPMKRGQLRRG